MSGSKTVDTNSQHANRCADALVQMCCNSNIGLNVYDSAPLCLELML